MKKRPPISLDTDKLEKLFKERYESLVSKSDPPSYRARYEWLDYCDKHKIIMLHGEWLVDTLNEGKMRGRVCIHNCEVIFHENVCPWLLVPKKFAEKCLVLGGLP